MAATPRINSRRKGSKSEREVSKLFKEWSGYEFARTPSSGGLQWHNRDLVSGDIICTDVKHGNRFTFSVETKFHKDIKFEHLIMGYDKSDLFKFWAQALRDAEKANKIPLLMVRYNMMPKNMHFIFLPQPFFLEIKSELTFEYQYLIYSGLDRLVIMNSHDLFKSNYKAVHKAAKQYLRNGKS